MALGPAAPRNYPSRMTHGPLIAEIESWLIDEALHDPDILDLFGALCVRLHAIGVPLERAALSWPTLHPLFQAEQIYWRLGEGAELLQYLHETQPSAAFEASPFHHVLIHGLDRLRRRLMGPETMLDFPVLNELREQGFTDYLMTSTAFQIAEVENYRGGESGIMASWATRREGGFSDADIDALSRIQRIFAVACHASIQKRVMVNLATAYLGATAARQVMEGLVRRGAGERIRAVVWYSDLRDSTRLSNTLAPDVYLDLLKCYYDCTAQMVIDEGGEILDFIGDAVLAIFPLRGETGGPDAARAATRAMERALQMREERRPQRAAMGLTEDVRFSVAMAEGEIMFGNIGVPTRLTFSAIGPVVNQVSRMDELSKTLGRSVLVTREIAAVEPGHWRSAGLHRLRDFADPIEIFVRAAEVEAEGAAAPRPLAG
ncbi:adenylate cyclase [Oceanicella actignis]|uniref:Adenylate cyclase n=2 Tax=Oceanicella actignis TaxID=1189325 RepID=A0A1M7SG25_9RHOB|nr:adenylate cyclase [Oceanicella actignis]SHN57370.1 adenylate cyclase [Oceanicella actignis]